MTDHRKLPRRRHSKELKAQILTECDQPGASVASVAMSHGINANVVHKWRRQAAGQIEPSPAAGFVPLALPAPSPAADIRIELQHGATRMAVTWPAGAAAECAVWMSELLK
ncbi:transposase [Ramlibacter sp. USB13]|uniref:Transposase n=1 Tax=Ramlibacter cellulosilyticus TaxID=2764187 RepID=A0A923MRX1_9BURK|nr:transposase [Ramlibacter cellulosilyticus]MBC5783796.1 transposase [Ramlibacter cellulosilyticus]